MSKQRSKKSKQQKRQQAAAQRRSQKRADVEQDVVIPEGPLSPGDRINLILASFGRTLDSKPFAARVVALMADFLICGFFLMIPVTISINMAGVPEANGFDAMHEAGMSFGALALTLSAALLVSCIYYVLVPYRLLPGKTPGKLFTHRKIVMQDGSAATLSALFVRWLVMTFCETISTFASTLFIQFVSIFLGSTVGNAYNMLGGLITAISAWLVFTRTPDRLALHDIAAGTCVRLDR